MQARSKIPELSLKTRQRFLKNTDFAEGCWEWRGTDDGRGYGVINVEKIPYKAHRISFQLFYGHISPNLQVDHLCKNKRCVNPKHLELVTSQTNNLRSNSSSGVNARKTHCKNGHELGGENVYPSSIKRGFRMCKTCSLTRARSVRKNKQS